jgi:quercetin dioxygenase-like cupin family protein
MEITRIWADASGTAHFEDVVEPSSLSEYVPGMPTERTTPRPATEAHVAITPPGMLMPWHPSPRRHLCITLSGEVEIRVGDGSARRFTAGGMYLGEDRTGQGHETEAIGPEPWVHLVVSLTDE